MKFYRLATLLPPQEAILCFMRKRLGEPIVLREIATELGFNSHNIVLHHIKVLVDIGVVEKDSSGSYKAIDVEPILIERIAELLGVEKVIITDEL